MGYYIRVADRSLRMASYSQVDSAHSIFKQQQQNKQRIERAAEVICREFQFQHSHIRNAVQKFKRY